MLYTEAQKQEHVEEILGLLYQIALRDSRIPVVLPQKEFMLLYKMASYTGKIFTRKQLMDEVWGYDDFTDTHTVEVHIGRLRERFRDNADFAIVTIRGIGYKVVKK